MDSVDALRERMDSLERRVRATRVLCVVLGISVLIASAASWTGSAQGPSNGVLRVRTLIVEDEQGRDRVVLGAPVPDILGGGRIRPTTGMVINDPNGVERFGLGLQSNGRMIMGFDAPPGKGDDRNRERINIVADENGGSYIRFLDRKTFVVGRMILDDTDKFRLEFLNFPEGKTQIRSIDFAGDERTESAR